MRRGPARHTAWSNGVGLDPDAFLSQTLAAGGLLAVAGVARRRARG